MQYSFKYYCAKIQARIQEFVLQGASSCIGEGSGDRLGPQRVLGSAGGGGGARTPLEFANWGDRLGPQRVLGSAGGGGGPGPPREFRIWGVYLNPKMDVF